MKEYVDVFSALLTPLLAIVAGYVAYQQYRTNRSKLKFELYEKRLATYHALMELLSAIVREADVKIEELMKFNRETNESYFLFGKDIYSYLWEIHLKAVDLHTMNQSLYHENLPIGEERSRIAKEKGELLKWFGNQFDTSRKKFAKHLSLR
jgi:hypothetical protein